MSPLAATLVVTLVAAGAAFGIARLSRRRALRPGEPWWRDSTVWAAVAAVVVLLGVFVAPQLLGFTFIFLPLFWIGAASRREPRPSDPSDQER